MFFIAPSMTKNILPASATTSPQALPSLVLTPFLDFAISG
jgi:hypothetical protein